MSTNPLKNYFRQPVIYLRLPSGGQFYPPGAIDMPVNGELPVYPMTAVDEITYRTPDALFNGSSTIDVVQSCLPNIKDGWAIPSCDLDSILIAIRIASYGHEMEFHTTCPQCENEDPRSLDLRALLDTLHAPDYKSSVDHGDLQIFFKPMSYKNLNDNNQLQFEEQRMFATLGASDMSEAEKARLLAEGLKKITEMTVSALAQNIGAIKTPDALVTDQENISDFLQNCDRKLFNRIRDHIIKIRTDAELKPIEIECSSCHHRFTQTLTLDMTNFFGVAS